jgi:tripartite-type tricarboxylate transporter receptor subunit TctC
MRYAAESPKRNDQILVGNAGIGLASVAKKLPFDPKAKFVPIYGMSFGHAAIFVSSKSDIKTTADIAALYKRNGRVLVGTTAQLDDVTAQHLGQVLGVPFTLVSYSSAQVMATDLAENRFDLTVATLGASAYQAFVDNGWLRAIAVIDSTRSPSMPQTPTLIEQGFAKVEGFRWTAFFVSADMPQDRQMLFADAVRAAMTSPEALAYTQLPGSPQLFLKTGAEIRAVQAAEDKVLTKHVKAGE